MGTPSGMKTTGHSRPLAEWQVSIVTFYDRFISNESASKFGFILRRPHRLIWKAL